MPCVCTIERREEKTDVLASAASTSKHKKRKKMPQRPKKAFGAKDEG